MAFSTWLSASDPKEKRLLLANSIADFLDAAINDGVDLDAMHLVVSPDDMWLERLSNGHEGLGSIARVDLGQVDSFQRAYELLQNDRRTAETITTALNDLSDEIIRQVGDLDYRVTREGSASDDGFELENTDYYSLTQTVIASVLVPPLFLAMVYVVTPIAVTILDVFGKWFVPGTFGDDPGMLTLGVRAIMQSGISAMATLAAASWLPRARQRIVAAVFVFFVVAWAGLLAYAAYLSDSLAMAFRWPLLGAVPAMIVGYWSWRDAES